MTDLMLIIDWVGLDWIEIKNRKIDLKEEI